MKLFVTGGAGFIGSHVADAFLNLGHEVVIFDNLSTGRRENINPQARFIEGDLCDDSLLDILRAESPDVISHHAAQIDVRKSVSDPRFDAQVNILGSINLLEAARQAGVKHVMFASTGGAIYGEQDYFPADENHPLRPCSPYGIAKLSVEKYLDYYRLIYGLKTTILRYANIYGPRQNPHGEAGVVAIFCERMLSGKPLVINGEGLQTRDYVFVGDVVKANLFTLNDDHSDIYNVGTGVETTVVDIFRHLREASGLDAPEHYGPAKAGEQFRSVLTSRKLFERFGWKPQMPVAEGLKLTLESFRKLVQ